GAPRTCRLACGERLRRAHEFDHVLRSRMLPIANMNRCPRQILAAAPHITKPTMKGILGVKRRDSALMPVGFRHRMRFRYLENRRVKARPRRHHTVQPLETQAQAIQRKMREYGLRQDKIESRRSPGKIEFTIIDEM